MPPPAPSLCPQWGGAKTAHVPRNLGPLLSALQGKKAEESVSGKGSELSKAGWLVRIGRKWLLGPKWGAVPGRTRKSQIVCSPSDLWLSWHPRESEPEELDLIFERQSRKSQKVWLHNEFGASEDS